MPEAFLKHFDQAIVSMFPSRSEAIRRGMSLVLREIETYKAEAPALSPEENPTSSKEI